MGGACYAKAPRPPRPNQREMTSPFPTSEDALKECLHLLLNTQRDGFPPSSPRGSRPPPTCPQAPGGGGPAHPASSGPPSPRLPLPLKATRRKDGRPGWLWASAIGVVGAAAGRSPRSDPRTEPPTGASFPPHSPRARRTMAPVGPRRSASARRPGLQLPGIPAARCVPTSRAVAILAGQLGAAGEAQAAESALGGPAGQEEALGGASQAAGPQHLGARRRRPGGIHALPRGLQRMGPAGSGEREAWEGQGRKC